MKKIFYGALFGVLLFMVIFSAGTDIKGAPFLTYVYSNSMEPLIRVNDGFFIWPAERYQVGDIIIFRPTVLKASFITHRIIGTSNTGFITKGDNSPYKDQDNGEPEVTPDRIMGKVLTLQGQPIIIPGLGNIPQAIKSYFGNNTKYVSITFFSLGIILLIVGNSKTKRRRKPRRRLRLHHIYRFIVILATTFAMLSMYLGSRVTQIEYLVSEYPGTLGDQVKVNQMGQLTMEVRNRGFIPVWSILVGISPIQVQEPAKLVGILSDSQVNLQVLPQRQTGKYFGYVQIYSYPAILPKSWITFLHGIHPVVAILVTGFAIGLLFYISFKGLQQVSGFEGWVPIKTIYSRIKRKRRPIGDKPNGDGS